jgi:hypothetical protein
MQWVRGVRRHSKIGRAAYNRGCRRMVTDLEVFGVSLKTPSTAGRLRSPMVRRAPLYCPGMGRQLTNVLTLPPFYLGDPLKHKFKPSREQA